jgi:hypothetical protein
MASNNVGDLGFTAAFNKVGDIFVIESKIPPPGGGGETGKSALGIMLDCTNG